MTPSASTADAPRVRTGARATPARRWTALPRAYPCTLLVFAVGLALRAVLTPITHGQDFVVWDLASRYTLRGVNVYAHHPHYPGGPYTYFPLFLYLELPFQWLTQHVGWSFTVMGKLPIIAGDILTGVMIALYFARRGAGDATLALGTALYLLNPLVLYNGAFYGRFDAVCVGLFLLALHLHDGAASRSWRFPLLYAIAVAAKTYPIFTLPWLLWREPARRVRLLVALAAVLGGLALPYLITSPARFIADVVWYNGSKLPGNMSWQVLLLHVGSPSVVRAITVGLLGLFVIALCLCVRLDLYTYALVSILLFLVLSKVVIEQYFLWPMPLLIVAAVGHRSRAAWGLFLLLSLVGLLFNPYIHPFGTDSTLVQVQVVNVAIAAAMLAYVVTRRPYDDAPHAGYA